MAAFSEDDLFSQRKLCWAQGIACGLECLVDSFISLSGDRFLEHLLCTFAVPETWGHRADLVYSVADTETDMMSRRVRRSDKGVLGAVCECIEAPKDVRSRAA